MRISLLFIFIVGPCICQAQQSRIKLENQVSVWSAIGFTDPLSFQAGGRYIPTLSLSQGLGKKSVIDGEFSANTFANAYFTGKSYDDGEAVIKPYRLWIRYASPRLELRVGLQKISFGSASILRPLMWFDKMDFRDPLQLTDGVYGFLGRYYFQTNENIWFWVLYGNEKEKGWEGVPTLKTIPEIGGRIQIPHERGELALTYHHRKADFNFSPDTLPIVIQEEYPEDRFGFDGKWDIGIGISLEGVVKHNYAQTAMIPEWETFVNIGLDYTFNIGNGLGVTTEFFRYSLKDKLNESGETNSYTALAATYPVGVLNTLSFMLYYNWDKKDWYRMLSIERKYDFWSFYLIGFWNPADFSLYNSSEERNLFSGKGMQLMAVINF